MTITLNRGRRWRCISPAACRDILWRHSEQRPCWMCEALDHVERYYQPALTSGSVLGEPEA